MFNKIFFILFATFLFSCYHENKEMISAPEKLLTKEQMIEILTDLQLSEGILTYRRIERLPVNNYGESLYNKVIAEHKLTREQLQENIDFYNEDPKLMEKIYDEVLTRLNKMQTELMIQAARLDSIQNFKMDSIRAVDSLKSLRFVNLVLIQGNYSLNLKSDTIFTWKYKERAIIPGVIY